MRTRISNDIILDACRYALVHSPPSSMNRRQALAAVASLFCSCALSEVPKRDDFQTYIVSLPPCDRIEVLRLGRGAGHLVPIEGRPDGAMRRVLPDDKSQLYHVEPYDEWWTISARVTVKGIEAERMASLLRAFQPFISETINANGQHGFAGYPDCHFPPFAYRFYSGDKLLYDTSVCWGCSNLIVGPDGKRHYFYFNKETKEAKDLLDLSAKLFPDHPLK